MNKKLTNGLALTGVGILLLVLGSIEFKRQEEVFRVGTFSATAPTRRTFPALRYAGVAFLAGGVVLMVLGSRERGG